MLKLLGGPWAQGPSPMAPGPAGLGPKGLGLLSINQQSSIISEHSLVVNKLGGRTWGMTNWVGQRLDSIGNGCQRFPTVLDDFGDNGFQRFLDEFNVLSMDTSSWDRAHGHGAPKSTELAMGADRSVSP